MKRAREPMFDVLVTGTHLATMTDRGADGYGTIREGALGIADGRIAWIGAERDLPGDASTHRLLHVPGAWATPGLVDCHTHLVYAGNRANEFEARQRGATYAEIARAGGGINATVRATRAATDGELVAASRSRLAALAAEGVTTVEIKSGYGLDTASECRQLRAARRVADEVGVDVRTALLAAHAVPVEYAGRADDYIDLVCNETIPAAADAGLADAIDAFCETIGFTVEQTRRVFAAARASGLPVKLHADQLSDCGGAALAAEFQALSADHLEYTSAAGIAAMARAGTVAVLLPGAFYALRETRVPPVAALRAAGVPIAIATDCNPGTSPVTSLLLMLNMACILFGLKPEEALAGATRHAARALGCADRGTLAPGRRADVALWDITAPAELAYRVGGNPCIGIVRAGNIIERASG
ncbi:MAG TPA: imidazolonepropionase [Casimicrobiaceae bacterium]|nr:imidazolonepropionase [Casimicrobiaceae bacterium]